MNNIRNHISVFEHESIRIDKGEKRISEPQFKALQRYYGDGVPFYRLTYNGIHFNKYVGVLQVGDTLIEVLPKADKNPHSDLEDKKWRDLLIDMLRAVGSFDIKSTSDSSLRIKPNTILDLYFELFIHEVECLVHMGLVRKYRKKEGNVFTLKGRLKFDKQIQKNLTHHERFYVQHTTFDVEHQLHFILYKTILLLKQLNTNTALHSRIGALLLDFPEMPDISVGEGVFKKLIFNRKTQSYRKALNIARLLLLQYHPDVSRGRNQVLALMFDMNKLWEKFVYISLKKHKKEGITITAQSSKYFWEPESGSRSRIRPDIIVNIDKANCVVIDTKWKNLYGFNPSPEDLRQMYVYHEYYGAKRVALVYPGSEPQRTGGTFLHPLTSKKIEKECSIISLSVEHNIRHWQQRIYSEVEEWLNLPEN